MGMHSLFDNFFIQFFYNFEAVGRPTNRGAELLHGDEKTSRQESLPVVR